MESGRGASSGALFERNRERWVLVEEAVLGNGGLIHCDHEASCDGRRRVNRGDLAGLSA